MSDVVSSELSIYIGVVVKTEKKTVDTLLSSLLPAPLTPPHPQHNTHTRTHACTHPARNGVVGRMGDTTGDPQRAFAPLQSQGSVNSPRLQGPLLLTRCLPPLGRLSPAASLQGRAAVPLPSGSSGDGHTGVTSGFRRVHKALIHTLPQADSGDSNLIATLAFLGGKASS